MNFSTCEWNNNDFAKLNDYLLNNARSEKDIQFEKRIVNTKLTCYAIKSSIINEIVKQILKSNYVNFLSNCTINNYPLSIIYGKVLTSLIDYKLFTKYFDKYCKIIDSWAHCDIFNLKIKKLGEDNIKNFIQKNIKSDNLFIRRVCVIILLKNFITTKDIDYVFDVVKQYKDEQEYYVNMAISWLLCDCFIKQKSKTLDFILNNKLQYIVLNKFISKCCDSYRINLEDKNFLKTLRKKEG